MLATEAAAISDPAEFFRQSHALLSQLIANDYGLIFFHDKLREGLIASFIYNFLPSPTQEEIFIGYEHHLIKELVISRQIVERQAPEELLMQEGILTEVFLPILTPDEVLGCLYFARRQAEPFSRDEIRLAEMAALLMANPMGRVHWEVRTQQTHEILNEFREKYLSILDAIPYPAAIIDAEADTLQELNRAFVEWSGQDRKEVFNQRFSDFCTFTDLVPETGDVWPPSPLRARIRRSGREEQDTVAFSTWLTAQSPEKRLILFVDDWPAEDEPSLQTQIEQIIYTLSHDLQAPIQKLKGFTTLLREEYGRQLPDEAASYLERIFVNLEQMEKFIADLLGFSRLQSDENTYTDEDSTHLLKLSLDALAGLIEQRPVNMIIDSRLPRIVCNLTQMTQVFTQLISNALKGTRTVELPCIEIGCHSAEGEHEFYIKDNGPGVTPGDLPRIFDLFHQREESPGGRGSSIGLAIVKRIIERHHGRVWAESAPTGGTIIKFTMPRVLQQLIPA